MLISCSLSPIFYRFIHFSELVIKLTMEESISPDHLNNDVIETSCLVTSQDEINTTQPDIQEMDKQASEIISDDEIEIICVKKREKLHEPPIKVESGDEEKKEEKDVSGSEKSLEVTEEGDGSINMKHDPQSQARARCNSPKDVTCSICLGEFDNKSFLDQCFHILFIYQ